MTQWIVQETPIGTNLGLYNGLLTLMGGHLLASRGAIIPALSAAGLSRPAVKRTWQALAHGAWDTNELLERLYQHVCEEPHWQPLVVGGYRVKALDTLGFFRPRLQGCRTTHYDAQAQRALPALSFGLLAELGQVNEQTVTITRHVVRAEGRAGSEEGLMKRLARQAAELVSDSDVSTADRGFSPIVLLNAGHKHLVLRRPKNLTMRRADLPAYRGRGRKPTRGALVRPLARTHNGKRLPASPPDVELTWEQTSAGRRVSLHAHLWSRLVLTPQKGWTQTERALSARSVWTVMVIQHPDFDTPWVILLNVDLTPPQAYQVVQGRWGIEQPPLVAKQLLGAHRQFVYAPAMRFRLPELALLASGLLVASRVAATHDPVPTGWWDRQPRRTAGRLRRQLSKVDIATLPRLDQLREKRSCTSQLPKGFHPALAATRTRRTEVSEN
jgi:hypothetical protein